MKYHLFFISSLILCCSFLTKGHRDINQKKGNGIKFYYVKDGIPSDTCLFDSVRCVLRNDSLSVKFLKVSSFSKKTHLIFWGRKDKPYLLAVEYGGYCVHYRYIYHPVETSSWKYKVINSKKVKLTINSKFVFNDTLTGQSDTIHFFGKTKVMVE